MPALKKNTTSQSSIWSSKLTNKKKPVTATAVPDEKEAGPAEPPVETWVGVAEASDLLKVVEPLAEPTALADQPAVAEEPRDPLYVIPKEHDPRLKPDDWPAADVRGFIRILCDMKKQDKVMLPATYKRIKKWEELTAFQQTTVNKVWEDLPIVLKKQVRAKILTIEDDEMDGNWAVHDWARLLDMYFICNCIISYNIINIFRLIHIWSDCRWGSLILKLHTPKNRLELDDKANGTDKWEELADTAFNDVGGVEYSNPTFIMDENNPDLLYAALDHGTSFKYCKTFNPTKIDRPTRDGTTLLYYCVIVL
jgi:hypothetical protein